MSLRALNVLVVDDDAFVRTIVADILRASEVGRIFEAGDGKEAFAIVCQAVPDIVILDLSMPSDGVWLLNAIRQSPASPNKEMAVIAMSGHTDRRRVEMLRDAGASEIIAKPLSVHAVLSRIVAVIDRPRPFVRRSSYVGPDRRRRETPFLGPGRRLTDKLANILEVA